MFVEPSSAHCLRAEFHQDDAPEALGVSPYMTPQGKRIFALNMNSESQVPLHTILCNDAVKSQGLTLVLCAIPDAVEEQYRVQ